MKSPAELVDLQAAAELSVKQSEQLLLRSSTIQLGGVEIYPLSSIIWLLNSTDNRRWSHDWTFDFQDEHGS